MNSIIRLMGLCCRTPPLSPMEALEDIFGHLGTQEAADVIVLPRLALCPPSCAALLHSKTVRTACEEAFSGLLLRSRDLQAYLTLTALFWEGGVPVEHAVVIYRGEYYKCPSGEGPLPLFKIEDLTFCVISSPPQKLPLHILRIRESGCDLVLCPCYEPVYAGYIDKAARSVEAVSESTGCAVLCVNGGAGDTSSPTLYGGFILLADEGRIAARREASLESVSLCYDVDSDFIIPRRSLPPKGEPVWEHPSPASKAGLLRQVRRMPYLPENQAERGAYLREIYDMQCRALAVRMHGAGARRFLLGVSGGLDSTLALLVCVGACDLLDLPHGQIMGVTMPGFGTSDRTYYNALQLIELLGCQSRDIPISGAVSQHFEDIGHNPAVRDVTYENAQARERAQVLFDLSNQCGGIVVGTGDLSEAALGFSTFGGDHLAGYNVNICLNKTTIRELVRYIAHALFPADVEETLIDILDTPVSPELLPPDDNGTLQQKSEEILGPYILHDFFLYYTLRYSLAPQKLFGYASIAFAGEYEPAFIHDKLKIFIRRFYASQFKRSCAPDSAALVYPSLSGFYIPSDMDAGIFLRELG